MDLTEVDCVAIEESLSTLMAYIQGNVPNLRHTSGDVIMQNILAITSAKKKLKAIRTNPTQDFSIQELKVMYWAIFDLRNTTREYLENAPISDPDHNFALDTQRTCNRLLRYFSGLFAKNGIDIRSDFDFLW